jgi:hypothetical protein
LVERRTTRYIIGWLDRAEKQPVEEAIVISATRFKTFKKQSEI